MRLALPVFFAKTPKILIKHFIVCVRKNNIYKQMNKRKFSFKLHHLYIFSDIIITFVISLIAFVSFYGFNDFGNHYIDSLIYSASLALSVFVVFMLTGTYKILTGNIGIFECVKIILIAIAIEIAGYMCIAFIPVLPRAIDYLFTWALSTATTILGLVVSRTAFRILNIMKATFRKTNKVRTLVIGAGAAGKIVVDESRRNKDNHNQVIAFVDDDINKIGGVFANLPVKGPISEIPTIIEYYNIQEVIIAIASITQEKLHEIVSILDLCPVRVKRLPLLNEMQGPNDIRIIDVDLNDLLSRDPIILDNHEVSNMLNGKVVLVTGAGGSIGSELTRQIFNTHPAKLILFDIYENSTYDIQMELVRIMREKNIKDIELITLIGSTYNDVRMEQIFKKYRPDYIYHAAAYKHVPLMEDSPMEAIRTNVIGTYNVARLADKYGTKKMVLVSTDKAVRPTNVMGATKRFAETIIQYFSSHSKGTKYAAVRFGNVLGSNGSVVPLFKKQIEAGGPVTITDKNITRYFMTIPEAVSLILQCGLFASGGEIFILDMGQPVKIIHLAERLIRQAGYVPYEDIDIIEVGLRPGEKLYEELLLDKEHQTKTANKKIFIEPQEMTNEKVLEDVKTVSQVFEMEETSDIKELLAQLIKTYTITENKKK